MTAPFDPRLDLILERTVDVPPALVWACWTEPRHITKWFTPVPWQTVLAEVDLRAGGAFRTVMRGPEGQEFDNTGCYLEVVENRRLVWTGVLTPGFRPAAVAPGIPVFTAVIALEPQGKGTKYTAHVMHPDEAARKAHEAMGFHTGWGKALEQLVAYAKTM